MTFGGIELNDPSGKTERLGEKDPQMFNVSKHKRDIKCSSIIFVVGLIFFNALFSNEILHLENEKKSCYTFWCVIFLCCGVGKWLSCQFHKLKIAGSNPAPATNFYIKKGK